MAEDGGLEIVTLISQSAMEAQLRGRFKSRFGNMCKDRKQQNFRIPDRFEEAELWIRLLDHFRNGFECYYCHRRMNVNPDNDVLKIFSFDHFIPLDQGGPNTIDNIVFCCHRCNVVKGTIKGNTFQEILKHLGQDLRERYLIEAFPGMEASLMKWKYKEAN